MTESSGTQLRSATPILTVNDVSASVAWYRDVLGFDLAREWKSEEGLLTGATLRAGGMVVNVAQDDFRKGKERQKGIGFRVYCETDQDVDELAAAIKSRGGALDHEATTQPWGARDFGVTDPDGFKISISNPPAASA